MDGRNAGMPIHSQILPNDFDFCQFSTPPDMTGGVERRVEVLKVLRSAQSTLKYLKVPRITSKYLEVPPGVNKKHL